MRTHRFLLPATLLLVCSGGHGLPGTPPAARAQAPVGVPTRQLREVVGASDRSQDDRALDAGRHPAELLTFFGVRPGMRVAELGAGTGYTTELLARAVGRTGRVYAQNPKVFLERFAEGTWSERLKKPVLSNVVRVDREFDAPLPREAKNLDLVMMVLIYHDTVWMQIDRSKMLKSVLAALKPGGVFGVVDHSARAGSGLADVQTLHRIDEKTLRDEVEHAGFRFVAEADFLRNPRDTRDWNDSPKQAGDRRGTSDRFVLKFIRPR
jgi:predicted methyltransferase